MSVRPLPDGLKTEKPALIAPAALCLPVVALKLCPLAIHALI
jgi:hypothetical protein